MNIDAHNEKLVDNKYNGTREDSWYCNIGNRYINDINEETEIDVGVDKDWRELKKVTDKEIKDILYEKLWSKRWRMTSGELYYVKNKKGVKERFIPNEFQLYYLKNKHNRNIILKARQMWFSTIVQLDYLDDALFHKDFNIGIIAQDVATAALIRKDKIEFALENLPDDIKWCWEYDKSNAREITLNNWSSIYISNTFRWGTLQRLHVSEYAKICSKRPDKSKEIKTGALESVAMDQEITIESTAEGNEGDFFDKCESYSNIIGKPHTPLDYKFFFFPWWLDMNYSYKDSQVNRSQEVEDYFLKLETEYGIKLSEWQKNRYFLKKKEKGEDMYKEYPSIYKEAFLNAIEGAYYESEINLCYQQWRVGKIMYDPNLLVYTTWDIWGANPNRGGDSTSIRFFQIYNNEIRFIDAWEWSWYSLLYILENVIKTKPYLYGKHIGPHDMNQHEYTTGTTRLQTATQLWYDFELVSSPKWAISNRIECTRQLFSRFYFDEQKCWKSLTKLKKYKRKWDEKNWSFQDAPEHNWVSHCADSLWYGSQWMSEFITNKNKLKENSTIKMNWRLWI